MTSGRSGTCVLCQAYYKVETKRPGESSYRREINYIDMFEEWPPFDPAEPVQMFTAVTPQGAGCAAG